MFEIECRPFPPFNPNKALLKDKLCNIIEPYDNYKLISIYVGVNSDEYIVKILDKDGIHVGIEETIDVLTRQQLISMLNIVKTLKLNVCQMFFALKDEPILVDVFDGNKFISPGMLTDIYKNTFKTQKILSTNRYNPDTIYNAIIKPIIVCYENNNPIYLKDY